MTKLRNQTIITYLLQEYPKVLLGSDLEEPHGFPDIESAKRWLRNSPNLGCQAASTIVIVNLQTGETEAFQ